MIIPVFNREMYLGEAIQSVLDQKYDGPLEIIVSDDGSTDGSLQVAANCGDGVRVVRKPARCSNRGASGARNRGLAAVTQPYVAFLDSDDFYLPNHLDRVATVLQGQPQLGFVFARMLQMREQNGCRFFAPWTRRNLQSRDVLHPVVSGPYVVHTNVFLFRREVFGTVGLFNEEYSNGEDGDLWMRISERYRGAFADHYGAVYRIAHGGAQLTNPERLKRCAVKLFAEALSRYGQSGMNDRFRLFRLRLILAALNNESASRIKSWYDFGIIGMHHPAFACEQAWLSVTRRLIPPAKLEWLDLASFTDT